VRFVEARIPTSRTVLNHSPQIEDKSPAFVCVIGDDHGGDHREGMI
jgi:hypothetical protein